MQQQQEQRTTTQKKSVVKHSELDINNVDITEPKPNKETKQQLQSSVNYTFDANYHSKFRVETPCLDTFKPSSFEGTNYSLTLRCSGPNLNDINNFFDFNREIDSLGINHCVKYSSAIFKGKKVTAEMSDMFYNKLVKPSAGKDGTVYPDRVSIKIKMNNDNVPDVLVYKSSTTPVEFSSIDEFIGLFENNVPITCIIEYYMYFVNGKAGINGRVLQIKMSSAEDKIGRRPTSYAFSEEPVTSNITSNSNVVNEDVTNDSEDENENN